MLAAPAAQMPLLRRYTCALTQTSHRQSRQLRIIGSGTVYGLQSQRVRRTLCAVEASHAAKCEIVRSRVAGTVRERRSSASEPSLPRRKERGFGAPDTRSVMRVAVYFQKIPSRLREKDKSCCLIATSYLGMKFDRFGRFCARLT